jgi:undecaprenyl-diphosphatase
MPASWDLYLFRLLNEGWTNPAMDFLARLFQHSWTGIAAGIVLASGFLVKGGRKARWIVAAAVAALILSDLTCTWLLKPLVSRLRPSAALEGVRLLVGKKSGWGFPSNHAANLAAFFTVLGFGYPRWAWIGAAVTLLVGFSRIYAGVHYPSDVLGGFLVGLIVGTGAYMAVQGRVDAPKPISRGR